MLWNVLNYSVLHVFVRHSKLKNKQAKKNKEEEEETVTMSKLERGITRKKQLNKKKKCNNAFIIDSTGERREESVWLTVTVR